MIASIALIIIQTILNGIWREAEANGFSSVKTLLVCLMKCSFVFLPFARALGAKRGDAVSCGRCGKSRFVWARQCPRCGETSIGTSKLEKYLDKTEQEMLEEDTEPGVIEESDETNWRSELRPRFRLYAFLFEYMWTPLRVAIWPLLVLVFFFGSVDGVFQEESFTVHAAKLEAVSLEDKMTFSGECDDLEQSLGSVNNTQEWLERIKGDKSLNLPEDFRIVFAKDDQKLIVSYYYLTWEQSSCAGERLRNFVITHLPADTALEVDTLKSKHNASVSFSRYRTFLDGNIHWDD